MINQPSGQVPGPGNRFTGGSRPPPGGYNRDNNPAPSLPQGYMTKGYLDEKGNPYDAIIVDWAREISNNLYNNRPPMAIAQLRRFFAEVRRLELQIKQGSSFDQVRPDILKLVPYAEYSVKSQKAPLLFNSFIKINVEWAVKSRDNFMKGFVNHFESIIGFYPKTK